MSEFVSKPSHGFATAVLTQKKESQPKQAGTSLFLENPKKRGLFLVSNSGASVVDYRGKSETQRGLKTQNRKTITRSGELMVNGVNYQVNARKSGLYIEILTRMIEQFEIALRLWSRVLVIRFDLHMNTYCPDSRPVSSFVKRISTKLKRTYGFKKIGYCWVREQEKAKAQHYHFVVFLEGRRVRHSTRVIQIIREAWELPHSGHHMPHVPRPFYFGSADDIAQQAVYRMSYLAKVRGKGIRPPQNKDFQCSRMKSG